MIFWLLTLALSAAVGDSRTATVTTLDGRTLEGAVTAWSDQEITIETAGNSAALASKTLLHIRWPSVAADAPASQQSVAPAIELIDGARFPYEEFTVSDRVATITGPFADGAMEIPTDQIRLVEFRPRTAAMESALDEIAAKGLAGDALVIAKRDGESMDYLAGVVGNVAAEQAIFEWDGERMPVKRSKIAAIVFYHAKPAALPDPLCVLTLADNATIVARRMAVAGGRLEVTTVAGVELSVPYRELRQADFSAGKVLYLSDVAAAEVSWTPRVAVPAGAAMMAAHGLPRNDSSYSGSGLSLLWKDDVLRSRREVQSYAKGLAIRSRTELTYRLPKGMRRFRAIAGIDPSTASQGHVTLEIRGDDRVLWEGVVDGGQAPIEIDVPLDAARRLHLVIGYGDNLDYGDRLHLVEARVTK